MLALFLKPAFRSLLTMSHIIPPQDKATLTIWDHNVADLQARQISDLFEEMTEFVYGPNTLFGFKKYGIWTQFCNSFGSFQK